MARLRRFITSYVGLVIGSLVVILVSMNALAVRQTEWQLTRHLTHGLITFTPDSLADYKAQTDTRTLVVGFESGIVGGLREAVTSLAAVIPVVSQRIVDEVRRDDISRASLATGGSFGLSADAARAVASQAVASTGLIPPPLGGLTSSQAPSGAGSIASPTSQPPAPTATSQAAAIGAAPSVTATATAATQQVTASAIRTATATATGTVSNAGGGSAPVESAATQVASTPAPVQSPAQPTALVVAPTVAASPIAAPTQTVAAATPAGTATAVPAATSTPPPPPTAAPPTGTPFPRPTDVPDAPTAVPSVTPTGTAIPTATTVPTVTSTPQPEYLMDLTVVGGSSTNSQPIFSGAFEFRAGETQSRTVNIQNNGSRDFRYFVGTTGGSGVLWTDSVSGIQMSITRNGTLVYSGQLAMADQQIGQLSRGGQDVLVISVWLPATANNSYQSQSTTVTYNFTAVAP